MRKIVKHRVLTLHWVLVLALLLTACAPTVAPAAPAEGQPAAEEAAAPAEDFEWVTPERVGDPNAPMTISIALDATYSHQTTIESRLAYLTEKYEAWTRANPDVQLTFQPYTGNIPQDHARLLELASSGRAPDIAMLDGQLAPNFHQFLQPLDQFVSEEELADWFSWAREGAMIDPTDGSLKTLWFTTNTVGLWYRQDLVPEPPLSWEDFLATAVALKEEQGFQYGFTTQAATEQIPYGLVLPFFFALGGELVDDAGTPIYGEEPNRTAMIGALDFWRQAIETGATDAKILDIASAADQHAEIAANSTAMVIGGSWLLPGIRDVADIETWSFNRLPQQDPENPTQVVGGWTWGVFTDDPEKQAKAVDFILTVYAGKEGMAGWCEAGGYSPVRESIYEEFEVFSQDRFHQKFNEAIGYGRTRPGVPAYAIISESIQNAFQEVILGVSTPEQAVDTAWSYVQLETQ